MLKHNIFFVLLFLSIFSSFAEKIVLKGPISEKEFVDRDDVEEIFFENGCGVTEIPDYAFMGCGNLRKVTLPDGLKKIGFQAFSECASLESVNFPSSLEDIGSNAFSYCSKLDGLQFPLGLKHIGHNAFSFCVCLKELILPDSLDEIESYAFSDCDSLSKAKLPANDNLLGELIFNCCPSLYELTEPSESVPPFDCNSFIFDPLDTEAYQRCTLIVPASSLAAYRQSPSWTLFEAIIGVFQ